MSFFINSLDLCPQIASQGWWQQCQLSSSVMSHVPLPLETPAQAKPEHPLLVFSLHRRPATEQPASQGPWLDKAWLRDYCVCLHLLLLKSQGKLPFVTLNHAMLYSGSTQSLVFLMGSFSACELPLPFLRGNSKEAQAPRQTDALMKQSSQDWNVSRWPLCGHCNFPTGIFNAACESLHGETVKSWTSYKCQKIKTHHYAETSERAYNFCYTYYSRTMCSHVSIGARACTHTHSSTREQLFYLLTSPSSSYVCKRNNL